MKTSITFIVISLSILCSCTNKTAAVVEAEKNSVDLTNYIQHTVMFSLKYDNNSVEEKAFLEDAERILSALPTVNNFEVKKQVNPKNNFKFYFSMYFKDSVDYNAYNNHPQHIDFVEKRWNEEVVDFLEGDFVLR